MNINMAQAQGCGDPSYGLYARGGTEMSHQERNKGVIPMQVSMYADLRYPFEVPIMEDFNGTLDQCLQWAYEKTEEMVDYFPKRNNTILSARSFMPDSIFDFVVYSKRTKHYVSFRFNERKELI